MNQSELQLLFSRAERTNPSVLSVYLNVDQSRQANLNRGFERQLKDTMASIRNSIHDPSDLEKFTLAAHYISDFVSAYRPVARGLVLFFDASDGFFWHAEVDVQLHAQARWDRDLLLQPLASALDQFERYGVVLVDRNNVRLLTVFLGEIEDLVREGFGPNRVRHIKTVGTDHIASASAVQRKADEQIRANLRRITKTVDSLVQTKKLNRLVLAGTPEITAELRDLLPKRLSSRVIGAVDVKMDAPASDVLAATRNIAAEYERSTELETVKEVVTAAAKKAKSGRWPGTHAKGHQFRPHLAVDLFRGLLGAGIRVRPVRGVAFHREDIVPLLRRSRSVGQRRRGTSRGPYTSQRRKD
jgi:peptide chain release factor subunit 1